MVIVSEERWPSTGAEGREGWRTAASTSSSSEARRHRTTSRVLSGWVHTPTYWFPQHAVGSACPAPRQYRKSVRRRRIPSRAYDIAWQTGRTLHVVEGRTTTPGSEVQQLRLGLGQVLEYRTTLQGQGRRARAHLLVSARPVEGHRAMATAGPHELKCGGAAISPPYSRRRSSGWS